MIDTSDVLNPELYHALTQWTGGVVRVINLGEPNEGFYSTDPFRGGTRLKLTRRGETYVCPCPFCGDTRFRMAVNHRCGVLDAGVHIPRPDGTGEYSWRNWELWKCYNEECQSDRDRRNQFRTEVGRFLSNLGGFRTRIRPVKQAKVPTLEPVDFPGLMVPLKELPKDHPAVAYLSSRGFDPAELYDEWGVTYATDVPARSRGAMCQGRIIVPVRRDGAMVGWQARYAGDLDWKAAGVPKYLTYFPKSLVVYGIDEAEKADTLVLLEGVIDVWRYGPGAVCGLGKGLSQDQAHLLASRLRDRPLVLVPDQDDPGSEPAFFRAASDLASCGYKGRISVAELPAGKDPADLDARTLRRIVRESATQAVQLV